MVRSLTRFLSLAAFLLFPVLSVAASPPAPFPDTPHTMGQPRRITLSWGPLGGYDFDAEHQRSRLFLSVNATPRVPQVGLANMSVEGVVGTVGGSLDLGLGTYVKIPWIKAGVEYSFTDHEYIPGLSAEVALERGGLFGKGDELRVDYRPWDRQVLVGFTLNNPFRSYRMTRPRKAWTTLPEGKRPKPDRALEETPPPEELERSMERVEQAVEWMDKLLTPKFRDGEDFNKDARAYRDHVRSPGHSFADEDAAYHRELANAFRIAAGGDTTVGDDLAREAEAVILKRILIPFDRLFGQNKKPHDVWGLALAARRDFDAYLADRPALTGPDPIQNRTARLWCREVFRRTVDRINRVAEHARDRWRQSFIFWLQQSRLVWLPLNYGLRPSQYDTPGEWNALAEALTGGEFTDTNTIEYLPNEQFHRQLKRMILDTETYHVLHIHDLRGRLKSGEADAIGWDLVINGYIEAFRRAVLAVDEGERERLPQFILFLDQNYYEDNRSRQIITYLEHLYRPDEVHLKPTALQDRLESAQHRLRDAVDASPMFRGVSRKRREELIRVQVNITNPFDRAFAADSPYRDHRKLCFRDVFETDPGSGEAIFTGKGVGEHYNGPAWEDRSLHLRGTALVEVKAATRELCFSQGFRVDEIPAYLRALPFPPDYEARCRALRDRGWTTPLTVVFNQTGYGKKPATTLKAMCYNLAPKKSCILTFDSLWISDFWAGMVTGAALRGVRVYVVSPGPENAPSNAPPTLVLMRENMHRLFKASKYFRNEVTAAGGRFHVGFYNLKTPVNDIPGRIRGVLERRAETPFLRSEFPFSARVVETLQEAEEALPSAPGDQEVIAGGMIPLSPEHRPFIHSKTHLFLTKDVFETVNRPEWAPVLRRYLGIRSRQVYGRDTKGITPDILSTESGGDGTDAQPVLDSTLASVPSGESGRPICWLFVGSQNQDRRGMLLDGEALAAVSGRDGLMALPDFMFVLGSATWPSNEAEFDDAYPEVEGSGFLKRLYQYIKDQI
jgi:hypothetical protein